MDGCYLLADRVMARTVRYGTVGWVAASLLTTTTCRRVDGLPTTATVCVGSLVDDDLWGSSSVRAAG